MNRRWSSVTFCVTTAAPPTSEPRFDVDLRRWRLRRSSEPSSERSSRPRPALSGLALASSARSSALASARSASSTPSAASAPASPPSGPRGADPRRPSCTTLCRSARRAPGACRSVSSARSTWRRVFHARSPRLCSSPSVTADLASSSSSPARSSCSTTAGAVAHPARSRCASSRAANGGSAGGASAGGASGAGSAAGARGSGSSRKMQSITQGAGSAKARANILDRECRQCGSARL